jgi:RNA polymerase sigma-70 factor (ECF subfamily)
MPNSAEACNQLLEEFGAYLETLTFIQVDPRLRSKIGMSDIIQNTLVEAWRDLERMEKLDADERKRWLRKMLVHNLRDRIDYWRAKKRDYRLEQSLEAAAEASSCRLQNWLAVEDTPPGGGVDGLRLLEALSKLAPRQREALILQQYHGWKLAQIAEHLGCTVGAVAGLHAHGLKSLHKLLTEMGVIGG